MSISIAQNEFSDCKAEEVSVAVAMLTCGNAGPAQIAGAEFTEIYAMRY
jgi:hypothetical protein